MSSRGGKWHLLTAALGGGLHFVWFIFVVPRLLLALYSVMSRFGSDVQEDFISLTGQIRLISVCVAPSAGAPPPPYEPGPAQLLPVAGSFSSLFICEMTCCHDHRPRL